MSYAYRVQITKYPEGSQNPGWKPEGWEPYVDAWGEESEFNWPARFRYLTKLGAETQAARLRGYGAEVVVERSERIRWPE